MTKTMFSGILAIFNPLSTTKQFQLSCLLVSQCFGFGNQFWNQKFGKVNSSLLYVGDNSFRSDLFF